jgi:hypothetical protein
MKSRLIKEPKELNKLNVELNAVSGVMYHIKNKAWEVVMKHSLEDGNLVPPEMGSIPKS